MIELGVIVIDVLVGEGTKVLMMMPVEVREEVEIVK